MMNTISATPRSLIGIPLGDIAGVGPEIVAMALAQPAIYETARPLVIGEAGALRRALRIVGLNLAINPITNPAEGEYRPGVIDLVEIGVDALVASRGELVGRFGGLAQAGSDARDSDRGLGCICLGRRIACRGCESGQTSQSDS